MNERLKWCGWSLPKLPGFSYMTDYSEVMHYHFLFVNTEDNGISLSSEYPFKNWNSEPSGSWKRFDCVQNGVRLDGLYREQQEDYGLKPFIMFRVTECDEKNPDRNFFTGQFSVGRALTEKEKASLLALLYGIAREKEAGADGII
ncbi:MAG: hypothetical protein ACI4IW_03375 [Oscillospiraceae bacterium]